MKASVAVRLVACSTLGVVAAAAAWRALRPIEPFLDVKAAFDVRTGHSSLWTVEVKVRGGETIDEIRVEPESGPVHVITPARAGLKPGFGTDFRIEVDGKATGVVRVVQTGRVSRTYKVTLAESSKAPL